MHLRDPQTTNSARLTFAAELAAMVNTEENMARLFPALSLLRTIAGFSGSASVQSGTSNMLQHLGSLEAPPCHLLHGQRLHPVAAGESSRKTPSVFSRVCVHPHRRASTCSCALLYFAITLHLYSLLSQQHMLDSPDLNPVTLTWRAFLNCTGALVQHPLF